MLHKQFESYLNSIEVSPKSIKNYKSDISHFLAWAVLKLKTFGTYIEDLSELVPFLSQDLALEYRQSMTKNSVPKKTINRRLSTLRQLSKFLLGAELLDFDFTDGIRNVNSITSGQSLSSSSILDQFVSHLEAKKASKNTIKNYSSDIRQFLSWLENNHARFT